MKKILLLSILVLSFAKTFSMNLVVDLAQGDTPAHVLNGDAPSNAGDASAADLAPAVDQELEDRLELAKLELKKTTLSPEQQQQAMSLLRVFGATQGHRAISANMVQTTTTAILLEARLAKEKAGQLQAPSAPAMAAAAQPDVISQSDGDTLQDIGALLRILTKKIEAASTIQSKVAQLRARLRSNAQNKKGAKNNKLSENEALTIIEQFITEQKQLELASQAASAADNADDNASANNQPEQSQAPVQEPVSHAQPDAGNQQEPEITVDTELPLATIQQQLEKYINAPSSSSDAPSSSSDEIQQIHAKLKELTEASPTKTISKRTAVKAVIDVRTKYKQLQAEHEQKEREEKAQAEQQNSSKSYTFDPGDSPDQQRPPMEQADPESLVDELPNPHPEGSANFYVHQVVNSAAQAGHYIPDIKKSALLIALITESDNHPKGIIPVETAENITQRILGAPQQQNQFDDEDEEKGNAERKQNARSSREDDAFRQAQQLSLADQELQEAEELALALAQIASYESSQLAQSGLDDEERKIRTSEQQASSAPKKPKPSSASPEQLGLDNASGRTKKPTATHVSSVDKQQQLTAKNQQSEPTNQKQSANNKPKSQGKKQPEPTKSTKQSQSQQTPSKSSDANKSKQQQAEGTDNQVVTTKQSQHQPSDPKTGQQPVSASASSGAATEKQEQTTLTTPYHQSNIDLTGQQSAELESASLKTVSSQQSKKTEQQPVRQKTIRSSSRTLSPQIIATLSAAMTIGIFTAYKYKTILHNRILSPVIKFYNSLRKKQLKQTEVTRKNNNKSKI